LPQGISIRAGISEKVGGSVWESNPPFHLLGGNTGFEVQEGHQNPMHSQYNKI